MLFPVPDFELYILLSLLLRASVIFFVLVYAFICCGVAKIHKSHIMADSFHDTEKSRNIILFEEDSLEVSFNACTVVMTSLPNCCYEGAKNITRDQACPVLCIIIGLKTFSFNYIKCHRSRIIAVSLNKTEENNIGSFC